MIECQTSPAKAEHGEGILAAHRPQKFLPYKKELIVKSTVLFQSVMFVYKETPNHVKI